MLTYKGLGNHLVILNWPQAAARHPHHCSLLHLQWNEGGNQRNTREKIHGEKQRQGDNLVAVVMGNLNLGNLIFQLT